MIPERVKSTTVGIALISHTKAAKSTLEDHIKKAFKTYDLDGGGTLDKKELRLFLNDLRHSLNLTSVDSKIFKRIMVIIDKDGNEEVDLEEFLIAMPEVLPILSEQGDQMNTLLKKNFNDFDMDKTGYLDKKQLTLLFNLSCDKMGVERCQPWQVDYIYNIIDDTEDNEIDVNDFLNNYRIIITELQRNKKLTSKQLKDTGGDFFRDELHHQYQAEDLGKQQFQECFGEYMTKYRKIQADEFINMRMLNMKGGDMTQYEQNKKLDIVNKYSIDQAKKQVPLGNLLNPTKTSFIDQLVVNTPTPGINLNLIENTSALPSENSISIDNLKTSRSAKSIHLDEKKILTVRGDRVPDAPLEKLKYVLEKSLMHRSPEDGQTGKGLSMNSLSRPTSKLTRIETGMSKKSQVTINSPGRKIIVPNSSPEKRKIINVRHPINRVGSTPIQYNSTGQENHINGIRLFAQSRETPRQAIPNNAISKNLQGIFDKSKSDACMNMKAKQFGIGGKEKPNASAFRVATSPEKPPAFRLATSPIKAQNRILQHTNINLQSQNLNDSNETLIKNLFGYSLTLHDKTKFNDLLKIADEYYQEQQKAADLSYFEKYNFDQIYDILNQTEKFSTNFDHITKLTNKLFKDALEFAEQKKNPTNTENQQDAIKKTLSPQKNYTLGILNPNSNNVAINIFSNYNNINDKAKLLDNYDCESPDQTFEGKTKPITLVEKEDGNTSIDKNDRSNIYQGSPTHKSSGVYHSDKFLHSIDNTNANENRTLDLLPEKKNSFVNYNINMTQANMMGYPMKKKLSSDNYNILKFYKSVENFEKTNDKNADEIQQEEYQKSAKLVHSKTLQVDNTNPTSLRSQAQQVIKKQDSPSKKWMNINQNHKSISLQVKNDKGNNFLSLQNGGCKSYKANTARDGFIEDAKAKLQKVEKRQEITNKVKASSGYHVSPDKKFKGQHTESFPFCLFAKKKN